MTYNCKKCGTLMQPTGELLGGFPFIGCPNCGDEETKAKIKRYAEWMKWFNEKHGLTKSQLNCVEKSKDVREPLHDSFTHPAGDNER